MAAKDATRLESLFLLLKEGSSAQVRANAAERLGEAAAASPAYCRSVLHQLRPLVAHTEWDVRVATSKCLAVVARAGAVGQPDAVASTFAAVSFGGSDGADAALDLATVDVRHVVANGAPLLRSGGEEYHYETDLTDEERRVHALKQRRLLLQRISGASDAIWKTREGSFAKRMLTKLNQDHVQEIANDIERAEDALDAVGATALTVQDERLDAREMLSMAKKKRLLSSAVQDPFVKRSKVKTEIATDPDQPTDADALEEDDSSVLLPIARLLADLLESMFDSKWETRHGSLLAIRQILISSQFSTFVQATDASSESSTRPSSLLNRDAVKKWLEECLVRCICVLALDQFVDYSADDSVAPVRELCAQISGILLGCLHSYGRLVEILHVFRTLFDGLTWHAHHGGLLGLKYLVQAHPSHASSFVPIILNDVVGAMSTAKAEEDVLVLAAGMLEDFAPHMDSVNADKIAAIGRLLWRSLVQERGRGFVRAGVIRALSSWHQSRATTPVLLRDESTAFSAWTDLLHAIGMLHHHSESIRRSTVQCVAAIANASRVPDRPSFSRFCRYFLPHVLLQLVLETNHSMSQDLLSAWKSVINLAASLGILVGLASEHIGQWVRFLWSNEALEILNVDIGVSGSTLSDIPTSRPPSSSIDRTESVGWRVTFADALGFLASRLPAESPTLSTCETQLLDAIRKGLTSTCGEMQCGCLLLLSRWSLYEDRAGNSERLGRLQSHLGDALNDFARNKWKPVASSGSRELMQGHDMMLYYDEQVKSVKRVITMKTRIADIFSKVGIPVKPDSNGNGSTGLVSAADLSREIAEKAASLPYERLRAHASEYEAAHFKRQDLFVMDELIQDTFARLYHRVQGLGCCAYCFLLPMPTKKSGFLVSALMDSLKVEDDPVFRKLTAEALADFTLSQAHVQKKCVAKIVSNLCNSATALPLAETGVDAKGCSIHDQAQALAPDVMKKMRVRVAGSIAALTSLCAKGGESLFAKCPALEETIVSSWRGGGVATTDEKAAQRGMTLMTLLAPLLEEFCAADKCLDWLKLAVAEIMSQKAAPLSEPQTLLPAEALHTQHVAAVAIATICKCARLHRDEAMLIVYTHVFSAFATRSSRDLSVAIMVLDRVVRLLPPDSLVPYIPSLVHYAMTAMASQHPDARAAAARAFAELVPLIPLQMDLGAAGCADKDAESLQAIVRENQVSRQFLESFLTGTAIQHTDARPWLADGVALRKYQQHGVDWLAFMARNNLHGILADDMGLGKTLQSLAAIAATLDTRATSSEITADGGRDAVCLVVCPPIVAHHWISETHKCFPTTFTAIVDYSGSATERRKLRKEILRRDDMNASRCILIVTTYAVVRSDEDGFLAGQEFDFVVLDEAHLIRNPTTALFRSVQQLRATHRLALSGTPLQNHVGDLWSLFEFLMPGYLGDFPSFRRDFALPVTKSKERNATAKQKEVAAIAIAQLHQRVLPFILRRTKDQVLQELPPKTISNVLLPLSSIQQRLYALASSSPLSQASDRRGPKDAQAGHVFTDLQILRRICVHPSLVRDERLIASLKPKERQTAQTWASSGKLLGLRDLLIEVCDVGGKEDDGDDEFALQPHRCLVFAHIHETLDLTERMLADALPRISFRRLDGRTPPAQRANIVQQFNDDPSIDLLLLTTAVGGLGLTLTGADTVIFLEHSWNPFVDMQAMDRAHRIGQKRAVRVFRLIMQHSLEEHIMNLQAFKQGVADTVVKQQSDAQSGMNTSTKGVLELLQASSAAITAKEISSAARRQDGEASLLPGAARELLEEIGELWDESQYESLAFPDEE